MLASWYVGCVLIQYIHLLQVSCFPLVNITRDVAVLRIAYMHIRHRCGLTVMLPPIPPILDLFNFNYPSCKVMEQAVKLVDVHIGAASSMLSLGRHGWSTKGLMRNIQSTCAFELQYALVVERDCPREWLTFLFKLSFCI